MSEVKWQRQRKKEERKKDANEFGEPFTINIDGKVYWIYPEKDILIPDDYYYA